MAEMPFSPDSKTIQTTWTQDMGLSTEALKSLSKLASDSKLPIQELERIRREYGAELRRRSAIQKAATQKNKMRKRELVIRQNQGR